VHNKNIPLNQESIMFEQLQENYEKGTEISKKFLEDSIQRQTDLVGELAEGGLDYARNLMSSQSFTESAALQVSHVKAVSEKITASVEETNAALTALQGNLEPLYSGAGEIVKQAVTDVTAKVA
jgi:hypothetical protein